MMSLIGFELVTYDFVFYKWFNFPLYTLFQILIKPWMLKIISYDIRNKKREKQPENVPIFLDIIVNMSYMCPYKFHSMKKGYNETITQYYFS